MTDAGPPQYKYKLVNGALVELTAAEIAELQQRDRDAMKRSDDDVIEPPPETHTTPQSAVKETHHAPGRTKRR